MGVDGRVAQLARIRALPTLGIFGPCSGIGPDRRGVARDAVGRVTRRRVRYCHGDGTVLLRRTGHEPTGRRSVGSAREGQIDVGRIPFVVICRYGECTGRAVKGRFDAVAEPGHRKGVDDDRISHAEIDDLVQQREGACRGVGREGAEIDVQRLMVVGEDDVAQRRHVLRCHREVVVLRPRRRMRPTVGPQLAISYRLSSSWRLLLLDPSCADDAMNEALTSMDLIVHFAEIIGTLSDTDILDLDVEPPVFL